MAGALLPGGLAAILLAAGGNEPAPVAGFLLESATGERVALESEQPGRRLTVLAVVEPSCAVTRALAPRLGEIEREYRGRGARFLGLAPGSATAAALAEFAAECKLDFPLLRDPRSVVARRLDAGRSGEVLLLDADFRVVYRGAAADDRNDYLVDALESALAGETIEPERTDAPGAPLEAAPSAAPTFHRDVAPILWTHCAGCHRPNQIGPMSFLDEKEAAGWAPQIAEVIEQGRMPPWHADPRYGRFVNERRLTETEKATLVAWAEGGAKSGDPKEAPPAPTFADPTWTIGRPDRVLELPEEQAIAAEGVLPYRYLTLDPGFTEDFWVQAVEVRPSARAATHHVLVFLLPPGVSSRDVLRRREGVLSLEGLGGYAPGADPLDLPDGEGILVRKGSTILFELHYTPIGKAMTDRTEVGIRLARAPVTRVVDSGAAMNFSFRIPPRKSDATFQAQHRFVAPAELRTLTPHMHRRGSRFRYELERADGTSRILLDVPRYDFNWQHTYVLAEPILAARGDVLRITAVFDNSKENPFNPDPDKWVTWGDQTFEEMCIGWFDYVQPRPAKE
jgi:mono/diheme cytochrome c family protein